MSSTLSSSSVEQGVSLALDRPPPALDPLRRDALRRVLHPRLLRARGVPPGAADPGLASAPQTGPSSSPRTTSSPASRSGSRPAASSSARSGATARTRRPTGRPTGCTARRRRCSNLWSRREHGVAVHGARPGVARRAAGTAPGRAAHQHVRPGDGTVTISADRAAAIAIVAAHYDGLFGGARALARPAAGVRDAGRGRARRRAPRGADEVLLLDELGGLDDRARDRR